MKSHKNEHDTLFVKILIRFFRFFGAQIARRPLLWLSLSCLLTVICTAKIPFTPLSNDVSDFTPNGARARTELQYYKDFFSNGGGEPLTVYVFVTAKNDGNMLGLRQLEEAVRILNVITDQLTLKNTITGENLTFSQFCTSFCTINEPVHHFYNGLLVGSNFDNYTEHIDLGTFRYPITTVLGRQLHMDPHLFGVKVPQFLKRFQKIAVEVGNATRVVSVNKLRSASGKSLLSTNNTQVRNNIREIKLVGLQFRAEGNQFKSDFVDAVVVSETHMTNEVVRSGLTLIPFLVIGFVIMCVFSTITMSLSALYMNQLGIHNVILAVMACVCPFMAVGTALGGMFWVGLRFGSILCVTPFLVLAIGVDDAYLMVNAWQNIRKKIKDGCVDGHKLVTKGQILEHLMVEVMVDTGNISITTITNFLAFMVGIFSSTPEIQLFSIGNALAIVLDYIYQWTVFGSFMVLTGRWELRELESSVSENGSAKKIVTSSKNGIDSLMRSFNANMKTIANYLLSAYCRILSNTLFASLVVAALAGYFYISVYGVLEMRAELRPEQLFIENSDIIKVLDLRNRYIVPFYAVCFVFVNNPGNFSNPKNIQRLSDMVNDFENLPSSLGSFATKFFIRDYQEFIHNADESSKLLSSELLELEEEQLPERSKNELKQFLEWPEFEFWNGFVQLETDPQNPDNIKLKRFFFTIASHGSELKEWSKRAQLLDQWRHIADSYPEFDVSVYEDDAKFPRPHSNNDTSNHSISFLYSFVHVPCLLVVYSAAYRRHRVFGILSLWGIELDPIVLSSVVMGIGFSVDIPGHITYHFTKLGLFRQKISIQRQLLAMNEKAQLSTREQLQECLSSIGFPILEAGFSTIICVTSLTFVNLHMARVFSLTMTLVVALSLVHGLLIIPVMFYLISLLPFGQSITLNSESAIETGSVKPISLEVNLKM
ncbi:SSD domain-containing protein [Aphelenchoides bicaudatus]|nr:SSD domain-containing protein [Aphelenchoides bicaudatus]